MTNDFITIVSQACFMDHVKDNHGDTHDYSVTAIVVRFAPLTLNKYNDIFNYIDDPLAYDANEDYEERCHNRELTQQAFKSWICGLLDISSEGVTITQNVSEIFTVVQITPTKAGDINGL